MCECRQHEEWDCICSLHGPEVLRRHHVPAMGGVVLDGQHLTEALGFRGKVGVAARTSAVYRDRFTGLKFRL